MALIVEDGSGVLNANTYIDLIYTNAYFTSINNTVWVTFSDAEKEAAVLRAMVYLEGLPWKGDKSDYYYSLEWPRTDVIDRNHYLIPSDEIPEKVKKAQCELALKEIESPESTYPDFSSRELFVTEETVDVLTIKYDMKGFTGSSGSKSSLLPYYSGILMLLRGLLRGTTTFEIMRS